MGLYKRGATYWLRFTHKARRVYVSTGQTDARLAEAWATSYRAAVQEGRLDPLRAAAATPKTAEVSVSKILSRYYRLHIKPKRPGSIVRTYHAIKYMRHFFWGRKVSELWDLADRYYAYRQTKGLSKSSLRRDLTILKAATRKAFQWRMIDDHPLAEYRLEKVDDERIRYIEDDEFYRLMNAAHPDIQGVILFARHTGMRQGEILKLQWQDVDLRRGWALITSAHSKNKEGRFVQLTTEITELLEKTPVSQRTGWIFTHHGRPLNRHGFFLHRFHAAVRLAGLVDFRFHDLRHTWASHAAMRGADAQSIAKALGHKTLRMVQRYSHLSPAHMRATMELAAPRKSPTTGTKKGQSAFVATNNLARENEQIEANLQADVELR